MGSRVKVVAIVCIAIFAITAIAAAPLLATLDAQTPMDALFWTPASAPPPLVDSQPLPDSPATEVRSPRAPPLS